MLMQLSDELLYPGDFRSGLVNKKKLVFFLGLILKDLVVEFVKRCFSFVCVESGLALITRPLAIVGAAFTALSIAFLNDRYPLLLLSTNWYRLLLNWILL